MTGDALIAARYAGALSSLIEERGDASALDAISRDLAMLRTMLSGSEDLRRAASSPLVTGAERGRVIQALAAGSEFSELTRKFLGVVAANNRLGDILAIIDAFLADVARRHGQITVEVTTARPLDAARLAGIETSLNQALAAKTSLNVHVDPSLIGGIVVKVGSRLIDASVKTRLDRLGRLLKSAA